MGLLKPMEPKRAKTSQSRITRETKHDVIKIKKMGLQTTDRTGLKLFQASFKSEDCQTLKKKLAKLEPVVDKYAPPSAHQFRDEIPDEKNALKNVFFKTRFKCDPLENPYNMSQHDLRPKEALEKDEKEKKKKERENDEMLSKFLGKYVANKNWRKYFRRSDLHRKEGFIDHKPPEFIGKEHYVEPTQIMNNLLRGEAVYGENFKLFHRSLRSTDKNLFFGDNKNSKF